MPRSPFAVLEIPLDASLETIKAAWRRLAREHHPDVTSGSSAEERRANRRMAEINAAYHELRDPELRRRHRDAAARTARAAGEPIYADAQPPQYRHGSPGAARTGRPVTARIDTTALLRPRNSTLVQLSRSTLPGHPPRPRAIEDREPPRASTPSGPTLRRTGPNFESELPSLRDALDTELRFGKFAGLTLGDVASLEPSYVDWIVHTIGIPGINLAARVVLRHLERSGRRRLRRDDAMPADSDG
jgi:curved DNA-binding protein CbpA